MQDDLDLGIKVFAQAAVAGYFARNHLHSGPGAPKLWPEPWEKMATAAEAQIRGALSQLESAIYDAAAHGKAAPTINIDFESTLGPIARPALTGPSSP